MFAVTVLMNADWVKYFRKTGYCITESKRRANLPCTIDFQTIEEQNEAIDYFHDNCKFRIIVNIDRLINQTGYTGANVFSDEYLKENNDYSDELDSIKK